MDDNNELQIQQYLNLQEAIRRMVVMARIQGMAEALALFPDPEGYSKLQVLIQWSQRDLLLSPRPKT